MLGCSASAAEPVWDFAHAETTPAATTGGMRTRRTPSPSSFVLHFKIFARQTTCHPNNNGAASEAQRSVF
ncbi:hypothetical protein AV530_016240 [Patagioenas fasciata monilis]|uniref:Uncharacterized protein n=1 Tax=Patagioenas fasciata monilis TaxID=372326 RepID=A0A1V4JWR4_PATFA|nr:hypothetical protein AV530_016240 [Patagioenas fasciata monilis]